ncbi:LysR family transcriptional regulator [Thioclava sp. FR2]|uniref:LysR family transcriptional regulator n=1 Tax=Thioclava sp. FR2 TaxID=3445780 RepID=UPI003EBD2810
MNISSAGRALGMGPAVASAKLAKLEATLKTELLHRSTRKVTLSIDGAAFLPYAREIIAQEDAGRAALGLDRAKIEGTVRFAAPSTFPQLYLVPLLPKLLAAYPGLSLDLRLSDLPLNTVEGSFDLALRSGKAPDSALKGRKLASDRRILVASPAYLARRGTPQSPKDLSAHDLLAFRRSRAYPLRTKAGYDGIFDPTGPDCRVVMDDGASQRLATIAGLGISMNSVWSVAAEIKAGRLVRVLPDHIVDDEAELWLVYPKSNILSPKVRVLIDFLVDWARELPELT